MRLTVNLTLICIDKMNFFLLIEETFKIEFEANELIGLNSMEAIIIRLKEENKNRSQNSGRFFLEMIV